LRPPGYLAVLLFAFSCKRGELKSAVSSPVVTERSMSGDSVNPRLNHAASLLADGRVLIVGGWGLRPSSASKVELDELQDAAIYSPSERRWTPTAAMSRARLRHTATLMGDGRVLVVGGLNREKNAAMSAEVFDPAGSHWSDASGFQSGRDGHRAVMLPNGSVLVVGGMTSYPGDPGHAEIFDAKTGTWQSAGKIPKPLYGLTLTVIGDRVLAVGGFGLTAGSTQDWPGVSNRCYLFDSKTLTWRPAASLRLGRYGHTATLLSDGRVAVAGGWNKKSLDSIEIYEPEADRWADGGALSKARHNHTATLLQNGDLLFVGGQSGPEQLAGFYLGGRPVSETEIYLSRQKKTQAAGALKSPHFYHSASLLPGGEILVVGGLDNENENANPRSFSDLTFATIRFAR
jgi:N-acetylneuraminic acid mutarotase